MSEDNLPVYESNATPEQRAQKIKWMHLQLSMIKDHDKWGKTASETFIRCGCMKQVKLIYSYRCRYCGVWYCGDCADEHFGMKLKEDK